MKAPSRQARLMGRFLVGIVIACALGLAASGCRSANTWSDGPSPAQPPMNPPPMIGDAGPILILPEGESVQWACTQPVFEHEAYVPVPAVTIAVEVAGRPETRDDRTFHQRPENILLEHHNEPVDFLARTGVLLKPGVPIVYDEIVASGPADSPMPHRQPMASAPACPPMDDHVMRAAHHGQQAQLPAMVQPQPMGTQPVYGERMPAVPRTTMLPPGPGRSAGLPPSASAPKQNAYPLAPVPSHAHNGTALMPAVMVQEPLLTPPELPPQHVPNGAEQPETAPPPRVMMPEPRDQIQAPPAGSMPPAPIATAPGFFKQAHNPGCKTCRQSRRYSRCDLECGRLDQPVPKEMAMTTLAAYVIEPPDILLIESAKSLPDQPIMGQHLVRMDGTVSLGLYGSVRVAGLTIEQAREVIVEHLSKFFANKPQVDVDVIAYNSKFYYIISDGAGYGEQVTRLPYTGNETVLDAISQIGGLPAVSSKKLIWIARPVPGGCNDVAVMPVNWNAIAQCGSTATNYQIFPGDRLYVQSDRMIYVDGIANKITSPINRVMSTVLISGFTVQQYKNFGRFLGLGLGF